MFCSSLALPGNRKLTRLFHLFTESICGAFGRAFGDGFDIRPCGIAIEHVPTGARFLLDGCELQYSVGSPFK
jgi:hypothetical protein